MAHNFRLIFWGLLLVFLDLKFNGFDVLPDFLGYALVAVASGRLAFVSGAFSLVSLLAWILAAFSVLLLFLSREILQLAAIASNLLDLILTWFLLTGVLELARQCNRGDLAHRAANLRIASLVIALLGTLIALIGYQSPKDFVIPIIAVALCAFVLMILILILIHRAQTELSPAYQAQSALPIADLTP